MHQVTETQKHSSVGPESHSVTVKDQKPKVGGDEYQTRTETLPQCSQQRGHRAHLAASAPAGQGHPYQWTSGRGHIHQSIVGNGIKQ